MGFFLNSIVPYAGYKEIVSDTYFVDKTALIQELVPALGKRNRYFCITRPRRFGKSVMANMIGAYFEKGIDSSSLFNHLAISESQYYRTHLNQHHVIYIDFSRVPGGCTNYEQYIGRIVSSMIQDLRESYPEYNIEDTGTLWDILLMIFDKTTEQFIFVLDEWDAIFHMPFITEKDQQSYLLFLKNLLKDQPYAELVYMTGVLPITKYSSGSELNMFVEYDMVKKKKFSSYFGFFDEEVDRLYDIYRSVTEEPMITREDLRIWYGCFPVKGLPRTFRNMRLYPENLIQKMKFIQQWWSMVY